MSQTENIQQELESLNSPLANLPKVLPFAVPEGYFQGLADDLYAATIQSSELPKADDPFQAPDGYLEALPNKLRVAALNADKKEKKIIPLSPYQKVTRIAAAAVLVIGIGLGTYGYFHAKAPDTVATRHLSKMDKETIADYVAHYWGDVDRETNETVAGSANTEAHEAISKLKSSEIQEYLREHGELIAPGIEEETL